MSATAESQPPYRGRFAPSPTGRLHMGSLLAALGSWLRARQNRGEWLIRIEDLDPPRTRPGASLDQIETLARFGMTSDREPVWQSTRGAAYRAALDQLQRAGLAYRCACSRSDLKPFNGLHPTECIASDPLRTPAWRARTAAETISFDDTLQGRLSIPIEPGDDFVLKRVEGYYAYQLAVVVDDAAQGITEVVRGADLLDETARQLWLYRALGLTPPAFAHLPLVVDGNGDKLSKSLDALPLDASDPLSALRTALSLIGCHIDGDSVDALLRRATEVFQWQALIGVRTVSHSRQRPASR